MCGRFAQSQPFINYARALDPGWKPQPVGMKSVWNMAPGRDVLVFHDSDAGHVASLFHWGFLPSWADPGVLMRGPNYPYCAVKITQQISLYCFAQ